MLNIAEFMANHPSGPDVEGIAKAYQIGNTLGQLAKQKKVEGAFVVGPDGTLDRKSTLANLYKIDPTTALKAEQVFSTIDKTKQDSQTAGFQALDKKISFLHDQLATVGDDAGMQRYKYIVANVMGPQYAALVPDKYDPQWQAQNLQDAKSLRERLSPKLVPVNTGGSTKLTNPYTGQVANTLPNTMTPGQQATLTEAQKRDAEAARHNKATESAQGGMIPTQVSDIHGSDFLKTLPPVTASQVKALAEGRMAFPSGYALKSPYWQKMLQAVSQYDPTFDAVNYNSRSKTRNDFTSGKSAQNITSLNTVIGHLGTLSEAADKLNNLGGFPFATDVNAGINFLESHAGDPRLKDFNAAKKAVTDELVRVWRGTGGSEGDIKTWADQLSAAGSPAQLHSVIAKIGHLLQSRIDALREQYVRGMGTSEKGINLLTPQSRAALQYLESKITPPSTPAQPAAPPAGGIKFLGFE